MENIYDLAIIGGGAAGLAALEAAARRELASAKKQGISLGGIFGGKK